MRLSTSTNILYERPGNRTVTLEHTLKMASEAGFRVFDMCFYDWVLPGSPFLSDDWEIWCDHIGNTCNQLGVTFGQCHVHFYDFLDPVMSEEHKQHEHELLLRSIDFCSRLGSKVCVTHPDTVRNHVAYQRESLKANYNFFERLLNETEKYHVDIAIENMCDYSIAPARKFTAVPEELVELIDLFGSDRIGICWDFEHAEIMEQDQNAALRYIGKRLKATHVSDTHSKTRPDLMHVMPCFGDIQWQSIMKTLREIDYKGDFSFEANNFANRLPDEVLKTALKLSYEIGMYLINL